MLAEEVHSISTIMFGIGDHKGVTLPDIVSNKRGAPENDLTVSGSKPHPVKPYNHNRNLMLPHISQKSQRPMPRSVYHVSAINTAQGSMLEAIEIYRKSRVVNDTPLKDMDKPTNRSVPCPTPIDTPPVPPVAVEIVSQHLEPEKKPEPEKIARQPTKLLPVTISLQKRLEKLARHKAKTTKNIHSSKIDSNSTLAINGGNVMQLGNKGEPATHYMHYTFNSTLLPKIQKLPRKASISYQLLEIPVRTTEPKRKKIMFATSHYDVYQNTKFADHVQKRHLSIVGGPERRLDTVWDYNKFLYLNVKI